MKRSSRAGRLTQLERNQRTTGIFFILPSLVLCAIFMVVPLINVIRYSLTDWDGLSKTYNFVGAEVTSMGTGLISMLLSLAYVKLVGVKTPEKFRHHAAAQQRKYSAFRAMSPYIYMLVLLPLVRYGFPAVVPNGFAVMCTFGYIFWVDVVILVCGMLGAATLGVSAKQYRAVCSRTVGNVLPVLITMGSSSSMPQSSPTANSALAKKRFTASSV